MTGFSGIADAPLWYIHARIEIPDFGKRVLRAAAILTAMLVLRKCIIGFTDVPCVVVSSVFNIGAVAPTAWLTRSKSAAE